MRQVDSPKTPSLLAAHMTAAEIYESVTNGGASDFAELVTVLNRNKPWCLIGGLAVNCYVEPVYTVDVDLVVVAANLPQIESELEAVGFKVRRFEHSTNAQRAGSKLNIQFSTDSRYQGFLANANERAVLGVHIPVAGLEDIVRGKVWAWQDEQRRSTKRKKDELDLMRIAETHPKLRRLIPAEIVKQL
ncbi:MAG: hypothetical protein ACREFF_03860 [Candidatus Udaeobacter sp.]